jgi:hypothetical protein
VLVAGLAYTFRDRLAEIGSRDGAAPGAPAASDGEQPSGTTPPSAANRWDDGMGGEITRLDQDVEDFDAEVGQLWGEFKQENQR